MNKPNPKVDFYFDKAKKWKHEQEQLRTIVLSTELSEELKWGVPCYTFESGNVVLIHAFKDYCALLFPKGVLLKDPNGILIQQTENTQAARQIRFASLQELETLEPVLKAYIGEAVEVAKSGLQVDFKKTSEFKIPAEFQTKLDGDPELELAFESLTQGRQRAYLLHFASPKQVKTRESRVEK